MLLGIIIGAAIGFALFGLAGALLGGVLGFWAAQMLAMMLLKGALGDIRAQFLSSTFAVMGAVCKADGQVTRDEIAVAEELFGRLRLNSAQRDEAREAFQRGKADDFDLDAEVAAFAKVCRGQRALHQMFLQVQVAAIAADGELHSAERDMLLRVARDLGLSEAEMRQLEAMLKGRSAGSGDALGGETDPAEKLNEAYAVLGLESEASDSEVKKAYRRQMSQNHPDKLAAKGLPESMREMAGEKTREIGAAYERIREARSMQ